MQGLEHTGRYLLALAGFVMGAGLLWVAVIAQQGAFEQEADKARLRAAGPPPLVDLAELDTPRHIHSLQEVHLRVRADPDHGHRLSKRRSKGGRTERFMWVLFDPADPPGAPVRAVLMMTGAERDAMAGHLRGQAPGGAQGVEFALNGLIDRSTPLGPQARAALEREGLTPARGMVFITPFAHGRDAGLAPRGLSVYLPLVLIGGPGGLMLLAARAQMFRRRR